MQGEFKAVTIGIQEAEKGNKHLCVQEIACLRDLIAEAGRLELATRYAWMMIRGLRLPDDRFQRKRRATRVKKAPLFYALTDCTLRNRRRL